MEMEARTKTYYYKTSIDWAGEKRGVASCEGKPELDVATPPEFKGHPGIWSPEDLFVAVVNACIMTTFLSFADRAGLALQGYHSEAEGKLELASGNFAFTEIVVRLAIGVQQEEDKPRAAEMIEKAERACLISNSIKATVRIEPSIEVSR
jgi:peroxiredoxin-like protein